MQAQVIVNKPKQFIHTTIRRTEMEKGQLRPLENFFIIDTFLLLLRDCLIFLSIDWLGFYIVYARMYYYFIELKRPWFILTNIVSTELNNATRKLFINDSYWSYDWLQDVCWWLDHFQQTEKEKNCYGKNVFSCRKILYLFFLLLYLSSFFSEI